MRLTNKVIYLYALILILYTFIYVFFKPRPKLNSLFIKDSNPSLFNYIPKNNIFKIKSPSNKFSVGKIFFIKDNENCYQVIQLSFWKKEFLGLSFLNRQLNITDINVKSIKSIKSINSNNYALGKFQGEEIAYSCMENSNKFNYKIPIKKVKSFDINHWRKVYFKNLNSVFYSFKPENYECYVVITNKTSFFENSEFEINKKIFNKFLYK